MPRLLRTSVLSLLFLAVLVYSIDATAQARRWVIVDERAPLNPGLGFISNHEGFERVRAAQQGAPATTFQVGGNFTNFLANVQNGDELIIIAHGNRLRNEQNEVVRYGFTWGGAGFMFFGNNGAPFTMPVPANFNQRQNVTVTFCTCFSARDPDGEGAETSLATKLLAQLGAGSTVNGFMNFAVASNRVGIGAGGTNAQRNAAFAALRDNRNSWNRQPPVNRPGTGGQNQPANQRSAGQAFIDAALNGNFVAFDFPAAIAQEGPPQTRGYRPPREGPAGKASFDDSWFPDNQLLQEETHLIDGCESDCSDDNCGNAYTTLQQDVTVPVLVSLVRAVAKSDHIEIVWETQADEDFMATVYRAERPGDWQSHGRLEPDEGARLQYIDYDVLPQRRYGYLLGIETVAGEQFVGETWLDGPSGTRPRLAISVTNPAIQRLLVSFDLPKQAPASLQVFDVRGRALLSREVGGYGSGSHVVSLADEISNWPAGIYSVRVTQGGRLAQTKVTLLR